MSPESVKTIDEIVMVPDIATVSSPVDFILDRMKVDSTARTQVEEMTRGQADNPLRNICRKGRLTASSCRCRLNVMFCCYSCRLFNSQYFTVTVDTSSWSISCVYVFLKCFGYTFLNQFYSCIVPFQLLFNTVEYVVDVQFRLLSQRYTRLSV